jgi:hypothetical protein
MKAKEAGLTLLLGAVGGMLVQALLSLFPPNTALAPPVGSKIIAASEFQLIDKNHKPRAAITILKNGDAAISFRNSANSSEAQLGMSETGIPKLSLYDETGKLRALLSITPNSGPSLRLLHADGKPRAWLNVQNNGEPVIGVCDKNGESGITFQLSNNNKPAVILRANNIMRGIFCVSEIGPSLNLLDEYGKIRTTLGKTSLNSDKGNEKTAISSLAFFDSTGRLLYKLP